MTAYSSRTQFQPPLKRNTHHDTLSDDNAQLLRLLKKKVVTPCRFRKLSEHMQYGSMKRRPGKTIL